MLNKLYEKILYYYRVITNPRHYLHYKIIKEVTAHDLVIADLDYIDALEAKTLWDRIKGIVYLYSVLYRSRRLQLTCNQKEHRLYPQTIDCEAPEQSLPLLLANCD